MKNLRVSFCLAIVVLFVSVGSGFASDLPPCSNSRYFDNCFGTYTFSNGDKYFGEYRQDRRHGEGTYVFSDGEKYIGEWKNGQPHGLGSYSFADASYYKGNWSEGLKNGHGVYTSPDGVRYVGEWKDHKPNGQGIYKYSNGNEYDGEWSRGKKHGNGTLTFVNGNRYVGQFSHDTRNGLGIYYSIDGWKFVGNHINNERVSGFYLNGNDAQTAFISSNAHKYRLASDRFVALKEVFNDLDIEQRRKVQDILKKKGLYLSSIDETWGIHTYVAVLEFSFQNLHTVDFDKREVAENLIFEILNLSSY